VSVRRTSALLVDDHEVVLAGLRSLLDGERGIRIVGSARTAADAVAQAVRLRPDVVVMDVRLADGSGIDACREIRTKAPGVQVIMLSAYGDDEAVLASITAGAAGYLLKQVNGQELVRAIETVSAGQSLLDPGVTGKVLDRVKRLGANGQSDELAALSARELRVLTLVADGKTNKEIAAVLGLSDKTVKNYMSHVFEKFHLSRRAEAAALFVSRRSRPAWSS